MSFIPQNKNYIRVLFVILLFIFHTFLEIVKTFIMYTWMKATVYGHFVDLVKWKSSCYQTPVKWWRKHIDIDFKCTVKFEKRIPRGQNQRGNWNTEQLAYVDAFTVLRVVCHAVGTLCWHESRNGDFFQKPDNQSLQLKVWTREIHSYAWQFVSGWTLGRRKIIISWRIHNVSHFTLCGSCGLLA